MSAHALTSTTSLVPTSTTRAPDNISTNDLEAQPLSKVDATPHSWIHRLFHPFRNAPPALTFLRHAWPDMLTQLLCLATSLLLYRFAGPILPRYFPLYEGVETSDWGRRHGKPYLKEYVSTLVSGLVSWGVPTIVMGAWAMWGSRDFEDGNASMMGLGYALSTSTLFQIVLKLFIGNLRPHFLTICQPSIPPHTPGLPPLGPTRHMYYTAAQVCHGPAARVREAQMSFPSGHASAAFAGFGFLALYLNGKLRVVGHHNRTEIGRGGRHWKMLVWALPWAVAAVLAGSKVRDEWHHPVDVLAGALIGAVFAHWAYGMWYRGCYGKNSGKPRGCGVEK